MHGVHALQYSTEIYEGVGHTYTYNNYLFQKSMSYCGTITNSQKRTPSAARHNFNKADWDGIYEAFAMLDWSIILSSQRCDELWTSFYETLFKIIDKFVPLTAIGRHASSSRKRYSKSIRTLQNRKLVIWRKWQTDKDNVFIKQRYTDITKQCRKAIYDFNVVTEESLVDAENIGKFYKHVNKKLATKTGIGVLKSDTGTQVTDPADQADMLNSYFSTTFVDDDGVLPAFPARTAKENFLAYIAFSSQAVSNKLNKLREKSAGGPDGLPPVFLKKT